MSASTTISIGFAVDANPSAFSAALAKMSKDMDDTTKAMVHAAEAEAKGIEKAIGQITAFETLKKKADGALIEVQKLNQSILAAQRNPNLKLTNDDLEKMLASSKRAGEEYRRLRDEAQRAGDALKQTGINTQSTTESLVRQQLALDATRQKIQELGQKHADFKTLGIRSASAVGAEINKLREAYARLSASGSLSSKELSRAHDAMTAKIKMLGEEMKGTSSVFSNASLSMMGKAAGLAVALQQVYRYGKESFTAFSDFDHAMAQTHTLISVIPEDFARISAGVRLMSVEMGKSATDLAKALYNIFSAGVAAEKGLSTLKLATKAATAGVSDVKTAATIGVQVINAYGYSIAELEYVYNILFKTVKVGVTTLPEIASTFGQMMPIAKAAGVSFNDLSAAFAELTKGGMNSAIAATGLKSAIQGLAAPSPQAKEAMDALGISWKGLIPTLNDIVNLDLGAASLKKLFPNIRAEQAILLLSSRFKELEKTTSDFTNNSGALEDAYRIIEDTPHVKVEKLSAAFGELLLQMGSALSTVATPTMVGLTNYINNLGRVDQKTLYLKGQFGALGEAVFNSSTTIELLTDKMQVFSTHADIFTAMLNRAAEAGRTLGDPSVAIQVADLWEQVRNGGFAFEEAERTARVMTDGIVGDAQRAKDAQRAYGAVVEVVQKEIEQSQRDLADATTIIQQQEAANRIKLNQQRVAEEIQLGEDIKAHEKNLSSSEISEYRLKAASLLTTQAEMVNNQLQLERKYTDIVREEQRKVLDGKIKTAQSALNALENSLEKSLSLEKKYTETARQMTNDLHISKMSDADKIRELERAYMTDREAQLDKEKQAHERIKEAKEAAAKAEKSFNEGDIASATQFADEAKRLAGEAKSMATGLSGTRYALQDFKEAAGVANKAQEILIKTTERQATSQAANTNAIVVAIEDQEKVVSRLKNALESLNGISAVVETQVNIRNAMSKISELKAALASIQNKTVTITTNHVQARSSGGMIHKFTHGGWVPGIGDTDTVDAKLTPGEIVINKARSLMFKELLLAINYSPMDVVRRHMSGVQGFKVGGLVQRIPIPQIPRLAFATGGQVSSPSPIQRFDIRISGQAVSQNHDPLSQLNGILRVLKEQTRGLS